MDGCPLFYKGSTAQSLYKATEKTNKKSNFAIDKARHICYNNKADCT